MVALETVQFGKYMLLDKIAVGGMAELHRAKMVGDQGFEKLIAIKKILPHLAEEKDLVEAFIDEARLAALLQHENIVQIYDFGRMEHDYFIAMEYLFGKNLRTILDKAEERNMPVALDNALRIAACVCDGLDHAHNLKDLRGHPLNIIHRDISPPNIFITYDGHVKVVDFGVAKAESRNTTTQSGVIKGKVAYMSPEQSRGKGIDHRSDIFSVGILLYELVCAKRMFSGETMQVLEMVRNCEFTPAREIVPDLHPPLFDVLDKALAQEPDDRYQSCGEMHSDLEECIYELNFRTGPRAIAHYMSELFMEEIPAEERTKETIAQLESGTGQVSSGKQDQPDAETSAGEKGQGEPGLNQAPVDDRTLYDDEEFAIAERKKLKTRHIFLGGGVGLVFLIVLLVLLWPDNPPTVPPQAMEALKNAQYQQAAEILEQAMAEEPEITQEATPHYARALRLWADQVKKNDPQKSQELLQAVVSADPSDVQALFSLGMLDLNQKKYGQAAEHFNKVLAINPGLARASFNLGYIYTVTKDWPRAEKMYERTVELSPVFVDEALANLAVVRDNLGKRDQAIQDLERAIEINPDNEQAKKFLQWLKSRQGGGA